MAQNNNRSAASQESTQKYLQIAEIKDDVVVMKDGSLRLVLMVSSLNFALKGEDEQNAIISSYVGLLNNLDFPLQIVIQSRRLNIDDYVAKLIELEKKQTNERLRLQTIEYRSFLKEFLDLGMIMTKKFFVVIPYSPWSNKKKTFWQRLTEVFSPTRVFKISQIKFTQYKEELNKRMEIVAGGLTAVGLTVAQLPTPHLIELYYNSYNPEVINTQKIVDINQMSLE
jgi:hypothetical protein